MNWKKVMRFIIGVVAGLISLRVYGAITQLYDDGLMLFGIRRIAVYVMLAVGEQWLLPLLIAMSIFIVFLADSIYGLTVRRKVYKYTAISALGSSYVLIIIYLLILIL